MAKEYIRVWLKKDIGGTYYVGSTILEDGKSASTPYPPKYKKLTKNWDNMKPHLPFKALKRKVTQQAKTIGYGVEINEE